MSSPSKTKPEAEEVVRLMRPNVRTLKLVIVGDSPLIVNRFAEESRKSIEASQDGSAKRKLPPRNPKEEFQRSMYVDAKGNHCIPAQAFKKAAVRACSFLDGIRMTEARGAFFVLGDMIKLDCSPPEMRSDRCLLKGTKLMIVYRAMYQKWKCVLPIRYDANFLSAEQVVNIFAKAGFAVGVGQWRPEKDGNFGLFSVSNDE